MKSFFERNNIQLPSLEDADNETNPLIVAHFIHPKSAEWWIIAGQTVGDDLSLLCMAKIIDTEMGFVLLSSILDNGGVLDKDWIPKGLYDVFPR